MDGQKESILIVDDDEGVLTALEAELQDFYVVTAVSSAEQALAQLQTQAYSAIVSDVRMPGVDGLSLISQCAVRYPNMVRIILTAFDGDDVHETAIGPHGAFKLVKPWGDDLVITLENALKQRQTNMELRRHLDMKSEVLDIDRRLHPQLSAEELITEAAVEMSRLTAVTAAVVYTFDEYNVSSISKEIVRAEDGEMPELKKTRSSPVPYKEGFLYSVPIGDWAHPYAAVALRLSEKGSDTLRYLDFIGRQAARTLKIITASFSKSVSKIDDFDANHVSTNWVVDELTTPTTVLSSAPYSIKRIIESIADTDEKSEPVTRSLAELDELIQDLENVADSMVSMLNDLRCQNTAVEEARPYPEEFSEVQS